MEVSKAIRLKRAVRKFKKTPLSNEEIESILGSGRRAQSSKNTQPWRFIAIQNRDTLKTLSRLGLFAKHLKGAALGVAVLTPPPDQRFSIMFDAGQAAAYMQLAAWEMGIGSCLASIYQPEKARKLLEYPKNWHLRIAISFGYPQNGKLIDAKPKKRGRKKFEDLVHWDHW
jgi:nitroreductase